MRYVGTYSENQDIATKEKLKECVEYTQLPITMPTTGIWKVTYANERFVSVLSSPSHAYGVYSTDGVHWTAAAPLPIPGGFGSIVYGDGKFVCTSARTNAVIYSSDGVVWEKATLPSGITCEFVAYGNGKFVAVPAGPVTTYAYSTDGINWVKGEFKFDTTIDFNGGIAYGNGKFVGVSSSNKSYYSNDGISWNIGGSLGFNNASSIAYGNGKFVVPYGTKVFYSVDGINWSQTTTSNPVSSDLIFYGGDKFFTYPSYSNNAIAYSTDGVTWYKSELPFATQWRTMAYGDNKYIITTSSTAVSGKLAISTDGINWTTTVNVLQYPDGTDITSDVKETLGVPTKVSELTNDARYITASQAPVQAINGKTGYVTVSTTFVAYRLGNSSATVTFAEMLEAWKRGDICILRYGAAGMLEYQLFSVVDNESITFVYVDGDIIREIVWTADGNFTDNNIEKSTVLNEASTDHQFPTSKTVWGAIPHPETKTDTQTQSVSVDSDGKLWTDASPVTSVNGKIGDVAIDNTVSTTTDTDISGLLKGANGKVAQAIPNTDYATPNWVRLYADNMGEMYFYGNGALVDGGVDVPGGDFQACCADWVGYLTDTPTDEIPQRPRPVLYCPYNGNPNHMLVRLRLSGVTSDDHYVIFSGVHAPYDEEYVAIKVIYDVENNTFAQIECKKILSAADVAPTIGTNGNWYIDGVDTGKPSRGDQGLRGYAGAKGDKGDPGPQGKGLQILGYYATEAALTAAVSSPTAGDAYGVGSAEPYNIYVWDGVGSKWVNNGTAVGVEADHLAKTDPTGTGDFTLTDCNKFQINPKPAGIYKDYPIGDGSFTFGGWKNSQASEGSVAFNGKAVGLESVALLGSTGPYAQGGFAGPSCYAYGLYSSAIGGMNTARCAGQTVVGAFAKEDTATTRSLLFGQGDCGHYVFIVGSGAGINSSDRRNGLTLDWNGNLWVNGSMEGGAMVLRSSTPGSEKRFIITVDDSGTISTEDASTATRILTLDLLETSSVVSVKYAETGEEITAMPGEANKYQVKFGESCVITCSTTLYSGTFTRRVDYMTENRTVRT